MKVVALVTASCLFTTACAGHPRGGGLLMGAGAATAVLGVSLATRDHGSGDCFGPGAAMCTKNMGDVPVGVGLAVLGTALRITGAVMISHPTAPEDDREALVIDLAPAPAPAPPRATLPLPGGALTSETRSLAAMTRNAVLHRECRAARQLLGQIAVDDPVYALRLEHSDVFAGCR